MVRIHQFGVDHAYLQAAFLRMLPCIGGVRRNRGLAALATDLPRLVEKDGRHALMVDGAPFLMLGVQANNSSNYPSQLPAVWPAIKAVHANTLKMPIASEQAEPVEGKFDFSFIDELLNQARTNDVKPVLLWFGTWKNNNSDYAPEWVKLDDKRFPRVVNAKDEVKNSLW